MHLQTLTHNDRKQAGCVASVLHKTPGLPPISRLTTSTMLRAKQTAKIIAPWLAHVQLAEDPELEEGNPDLVPHCSTFDRVYKKYFVPAHGEAVTTCHIMSHHASESLFL